MKFRILIMIVMGLFFFTRCSNKKNIDEDAEYVTDSIDLPSSSLGFTLYYDVKRIQKAINEKTKDSIFNDWIAINNRDSLLLDAERFEEIKLHWENSRLFIRLPLKLQANYKKNILGIKIKNKKPIETKVIVKFSTNIGLYSNWHLKTKSRIESIEWLEDPELKIAFFDVNLRKKFEKKISEEKGTLVRKLDSMIAMELSVKKPIDEMWRQVQQPMRISKKKVPLFFRAKIEQMEAKIHGDHIDTIYIQLGLKTKLYIESDSIFQDKILKLPKYNEVDHIDDSLEAYALVSATFDVLSDSLNTFLKNDTTLWEDYGLKINNAKITGIDNKLKIVADIEGNIDGVVTLYCQPQMDNEDKVVSFTNFTYDLQSDSDFLNLSANNLEEQVINVLQGYLTFNISDWLNDMPQAIERGVEKGKTGNKIAVDIERLEVKVKYISIKEDKIVFMAQGNGNGALEVEEVMLK